MGAETSAPVGAVVVAQDPLVGDARGVVAVVGRVRHRVGERAHAGVGRRCLVVGDSFLGGVGVDPPQGPLLGEFAGGDGLVVAVLPVVVLQGVDVVVLAELSDVLAGGQGQVGLVARARGDVSRGGGLEVGDVSHAREARPAGGNVQRGFGVRLVGAGCGHQVALVVLARCRVGPCGLAVRHGGVARGHLDTKVADGEVDGAVTAGFGGDGGLGAGGSGWIYPCRRESRALCPRLWSAWIVGAERPSPRWPCQAQARRGWSVGVALT